MIAGLPACEPGLQQECKLKKAVCVGVWEAKGRGSQPAQPEGYTTTCDRCAFEGVTATMFFFRINHSHLAF